LFSFSPIIANVIFNPSFDKLINNKKNAKNANLCYARKFNVNVRIPDIIAMNIADRERKTLTYFSKNK
jgi:hypothetical protein